jgi:hypothetical protein
MPLAKNLLYSFIGEDKSASTTMEKLQAVGEKTTGKIGGAFQSLGDKLGGEFGEVLSKTGEGITQIGEHSAKLSTVLGTAGGVITGVGVAMQAMGSKDKQASDQLKQSIENSGHSYEGYRDEIEKTISKQEGFGHSAVDTQDALRKLTTATNDPKKALEDMGLVANLAAAKHLTLADAADQVDKVMAGSGSRTLTEYGIKMGTGKNKTAEAQKALEELGKKLDGQASASMNNFGAQVNAVKTRVTDWGAAIGQKVGPALTAIGPVLMGAAAAMELFKTVTGAVKAAQLAQTVATEAGTVAQRGFNLSLLANPIVLIIVAIVALVAGLIWFFTQTKLGQEIWHNFVTFLGDAWKWLWNSVLKPTFDLIAAVFTWLWNNILKPYIGLIVLEVKVLGAIFSWLWQNVISPVANWIGSAIRVVGQVIGAVFGAIGGTIQHAFSGAVGFVKGAINGIIDVINMAIGGINTLIDGVNSIPGVSLPHLGRLPHMALGGVVTSPTVALIGESGPEAIVPLNGGGNYGTGGGGGLTVQVTVQAGAVGNEQFLARTVTNAIINAIRSGSVNRQELRTALGV